MTQQKPNGPARSGTAYGDRADAMADIPCIDSGDLFANQREIRITHRGEIYRMRITAQQKLILTK